MQWTVLLPAKALPAAKSRLAGASGGPDEHARLVRAIRQDTLAAAVTAPGVARVVVVVDRPGEPYPGVEVFVQTRPGLNAALREAAAWALSTWPEAGVAALVGDLPALRTEEMADALAAAAAHPRAFVADAEGTGTTLLAAAPGTDLDPAFGAGSAARHAAGAVAITAGPGLRHDVDTDDDLRVAAGYGLGPATRAALPGHSDPLVCSPSPGIMGA